MLYFYPVVKCALYTQSHVLTETELATAYFAVVPSALLALASSAYSKSCKIPICNLFKGHSFAPPGNFGTYFFSFNYIKCTYHTVTVGKRHASVEHGIISIGN